MLFILNIFAFHLKSIIIELKEVISKMNISLEVEKYLSEKKHTLYDILLSEEKSKNLIVAPMKIGKTTFIFTDFWELLRELQIQLIFISPKVSLLKNLKQKYKNSILCMEEHFVKVDSKFNPIISTAESMYKAVRSCEESNREFYIVYDEVHESYLHYTFRRKLINPFNELNNSLCRGFLGLTATDDNICIESLWDNIINVKPLEPFVQSQKLNIVSGLGNGVKDIVSHIIHIKEENKNTPIICRVNDKDKIKECKEILSKFGYNINVWSRGEEEEDNLNLFEKAMKGLNVNFSILFTTSLIDVGVEVMLNKKPIIIDFMNMNSRIIEDIQFLGRFRNGCQRIDLVVNSSKKDYDFYDFNREYQKTLIGAEKLISLMGDELEEDKIKSLCINKLIAADEEVEYSVNNDGCLVVAFSRYIKKILSNPNKLMVFLKNHKTLNVKEICKMEICKESYLIDIDNMLTAMREERKALKDKFKEDMKEFIKAVKNMDPKEVDILIQKREEINPNDLWIYNKISEYHTFYHNDDNTDLRKRYYEMIGVKKVQFENSKERLLFVLSDKDIEFWDMEDFIVAFEFNKLNNNDYESIGIFEDEFKNTLPIYYIRKSIMDLNNGKETFFYLNDKNIDKVYKMVKSEITITKKRFKILLERMYNLNERKRITSLKKYGKNKDK